MTLSTDFQETGNWECLFYIWLSNISIYREMFFKEPRKKQSCLISTKPQSYIYHWKSLMLLAPQTNSQNQKNNRGKIGLWI